MAFLPSPFPSVSQRRNWIQAPCTPLTMKAKRSSRPTSSDMPSSSDNDSNKRSPARINVDSTTLSVRQQLALVKRHAAYQQDVQRGSRPKERTSFRRKKDDIPGRRRDTNRNTDVPDGKYNNEVDPIIFIDGYNVIGRWPRLRKWRDRSDLETARRLLIDDVAEFSAVRGWDCVVVYDALGSEMDNTRAENEQGVSVIYTGTETADSFIERNIFQYCREGARQVWAATSDLIQARVSGAMGAHVMSGGLFVQELKRARRETREILETRDGAAIRAKMLMSSVDGETLKHLYRLRNGE